MERRKWGVSQKRRGGSDLAVAQRARGLQGADQSRACLFENHLFPAPHTASACRQNQSQSDRERIQEGYACVERRKTSACRQQNGNDGCACASLQAHGCKQMSVAWENTRRCDSTDGHACLNFSSGGHSTHGKKAGSFVSMRPKLLKGESLVPSALEGGVGESVPSALEGGVVGPLGACQRRKTHTGCLAVEGTQCVRQRPVVAAVCASDHHSSSCDSGAFNDTPRETHPVRQAKGAPQPRVKSQDSSSKSTNPATGVSEGIDIVAGLREGRHPGLAAAINCPHFHAASTHAAWPASLPCCLASQLTVAPWRCGAAARSSETAPAARVAASGPAAAASPLEVGRLGPGCRASQRRLCWRRAPAGRGPARTTTAAVPAARPGRPHVLLGDVVDLGQQFVTEMLERGAERAGWVVRCVVLAILLLAAELGATPAAAAALILNHADCTEHRPLVLLQQRLWHLQRRRLAVGAADAVAGRHVRRDILRARPQPDRSVPAACHEAAALLQEAHAADHVLVAGVDRDGRGVVKVVAVGRLI
eukprot:360762-Chlamydomonas_euryale.AAC.16